MAPFGFGVGDFITVGKLAAQIYTRCKESVLEFKDLSREVMSMQIVLDSIGSFWTNEEARGHSLGAEQRNRLKELADDCVSVLKSVGDLLDEHRALAYGSKRARMRWIPIQINPIRNKMILSTTCLAALNSTITASSHANSQARVLEALNAIQRDLWEGKRRTSAISRVTVDELCDDQSEAWQNINAEVEKEGVDAHLVTANQQFIRNWIDKVILEEDGEEELDVGGGESPPWPASATPPGEYVAILPLTSLDGDKADTEQTAVERLTRSPQVHSGVEPLLKTASLSSHRSKASTWRPSKGPNHEYVQGLLAKLLQSAESISMESITLHSKRIFHQLDWQNRGFLFRPTVEDEFSDAVRKAELVLSEERLVQLVADGDKSMNGVIDRDEFVALVNDLLVLFIKGEDEGMQESVAKNCGLGIEYCTRELTTMFVTKPMLPWGWRSDSSKSTNYVLSYDSEDLITSEARPPVSLQTFRVATLVADRLCVRMLVQTLRKWSPDIINHQQEIFDEYRRPIDDVLKVASGFALFERRTSSSRLNNELDRLFDLAPLVMNLDSTVPEAGQFTDLFERLSKLRGATFDVLRLILGFVAALSQLPSSQRMESPPGIEEWRKMRMQTRANHIREASALVLNSQPLMDECESWLNDNSSLSLKASDGLQQAVTLRAAQTTVICAMQNEEVKNQLRQCNSVTVVIIGAQNLPRDGNGEPPDTRANFTCTGAARLDHGFCLEVKKSCDPMWFYSSTWEVRPKSTLSIIIRSGSLVAVSRKVLGVWPKSSNRRTEETLGRCSVAIADIVGDLSEPKRQEKILQLRDGNGKLLPDSKMTIAIEPKPPKVVPCIQWTGSSIHELMTSINESPLPEGWQKMTTADGRTYFRNTIDEKNTIAYNFSVAPDKFMIPSTPPPGKTLASSPIKTEGVTPRFFWT